MDQVKKLLTHFFLDKIVKIINFMKILINSLKKIYVTAIVHPVSNV